MIDGKFGVNENKQEVPQIHDVTGISQDYINQISGLIAFYKLKNDISAVKNRFSKYPLPIKKYEDVYLDDKYNNVVNDKNRSGILKLDELVEQLNEILKNPDTDDYKDSFIRICNEILFTILGDRSREI